MDGATTCNKDFMASCVQYRYIEVRLAPVSKATRKPAEGVINNLFNCFIKKKPTKTEKIKLIRNSHKGNLEADEEYRGIVPKLCARTTNVKISNPIKKPILLGRLLLARTHPYRKISRLGTGTAMYGMEEFIIFITLLNIPTFAVTSGSILTYPPSCCYRDKFYD